MMLLNRAVNSQKGFVLVGVLCMMVLLAVTAATLNRQAGLQARRAANQTVVAQAYLGEVAAVEHAVWNLMQNPTWRTAAGGENYTFESVTYNRKVLDAGTLGCSRLIAVTITPPGGVESMQALFLWHAETLYISDTDNNVIRTVDPATGFIQTVAGTGSGGYTGDGALASTRTLDKPHSVWLDASCNLFIADTSNSRIRDVDSATKIIETVAGNGSDGYLGDGGLATFARVRKPRGVSVAPSGNIYIADTENHVIRRVDDNTKIISTYAGTGSAGHSGDGGLAWNAELNKPSDLFVTNTEVYIADTDNSCIRKTLAADNRIYPVAGTGSSGYSGDGGPATNAELNKPRGVCVDGASNVFIADTDNHVIRWVDVNTGDIYTIAGNGSNGYSGDGGPAVNAELDMPNDVYLDASGNLYIADTHNACIRRVDIGTGNISTVAGTGSDGYSGDGGLATSAKLRSPRSICINLPGSFTTPLERLK